MSIKSQKNQLVAIGFLLLLTITATRIDALDETSAPPKTCKISLVSGPSPEYGLNPELASMAQAPDEKGKMLLRIDTRTSEATWNPCFRTAPGMLKPNTDYVIKARCKILELNNDSFLLSLVRPFEADNAFSDLGQSINASVGVWENIFLRFHVPEDIKDYSFQIHTRKKVLALLDDITISERAPDRQEPVTQNISPVKLPQELPKGAEEFSIDLPSPKNSIVESVVNFGADVNSPDNAKAFNAAIAHCAATGAAKLIVPKGTYRFTSDNPISFKKLTDFEFDGQGSVFVFLKKKNSLVDVVENQRIILKDFSLDWDWEKDPLASVVKVESIEPAGEYADFRFVDYKEFPRKDLRVATLDMLDPKTLSTGQEKYVHMGFEFFAGNSPAKVKWLKGNLLRIYAEGRKGSFAKDLTVGSLFRMKHYYYDMRGINMRNNAHLTLSGINIYSAPGTGLEVSGKQHHWQFLKTNIIRPPGSKRAITCTADHYHVVQSAGYFKMDGCEFSFGGDDAINIHDISCFGRRVDDYTVRINNLSGAHSYQVGDPVELRNDDYSPAGSTSRIKSIKPVDARKKVYEFTFSDKLPEQKTSGFILFNRKYGSEQIIIRNCYFHDCPRVLLLARNVTFENNRFVHGMATAIKIETGYTHNVWSEGYGASNIVIRGNTFDNVNIIGRYPNEKQPVIYLSVYLKSDPSSEKTMYPILRDVLIEANHFNTFPGAIAFICSASNVFVRGNTISNKTPRIENIPCRGSIVAAYASKIYITGNIWQRSKDLANPAIIYDPETTREIHSWDNKLIESENH